MRIDDLNRIPSTQVTEKTDQAAEKSALEQNSVANSTDQADVSQVAQSLTTSDASRLEQLQLQVQSDKYELPAETLAKSIISAHSKE